MTTNTILKLSDNTISQIAKCVQIAILTGTDIVDHLRQLEMCESDGLINVTEGYLSIFNENIEKMIQEASATAEENKNESEPQMEQISLFS